MELEKNSAQRQFRFWNLRVERSRVGIEVLAGVTTFVVMSYIIVVNPLILGFAGVPALAGKGLPYGATVTGTCLVAGVMSILMGLFTNRAFALAPGMGLNAVVAYQMVAGMGLSWPEAMGVVVLEGAIVTALVITGVRESVMNAVPGTLKKAISVGIGLFILFIGLWQAGIVVQDPSGATPVVMGDLARLPVLVAVFGVFLTLVLTVRRVSGALIISIVATTVVAVIINAATGFTAFPHGVAAPPDHVLAAPDLSLLGRISPLGVFGRVGVVTALMTLFSLLLADFFDTMGTLVGVGEQAGYVDAEGRFADVGKPLLVDSLAAVAGGMVSVSSCTTYVESQAGIQVGGRTGLTAVITGALFLVFIPLSPLVALVPKEATAGSLIAIGVMMCGILVGRQDQPDRLDLSDPEQAWPVVTTLAVMPLTYSITNGVGAGFIVHTAVRLVRGKRDSWIMYVASAAFVLYFLRSVFARSLGA